MADNKRYLIALGLMETDIEKIKKRDSFKQWSRARQSVADIVEGAILEFCIQSEIYQRFGHPQVDVPVRLLVDQLTPAGREKGLYVPGEFDGTPEKFIRAVTEYKERCEQLEYQWMGFSDLLMSKPWGNRFSKQRIEGPGVPLVISGVVGSQENVRQLDSNVRTLLDHLEYKSSEYFHSTGLPIKRCVVARITY